MANNELCAEGHGDGGAILRLLREDDADEVVDVYRAAFGDARPIDAAEIITWGRNPEIPPGSLRVLELDGRICGYGDISIGDDALALEVAAPGHWEAFLSWAEDAARAAGVSQVRALNYGGNELASAAKRCGYKLWRSAFTMQIEFAEAPPERCVLPNSIELHKYQEDDAETLRLARNEVFANDPFFEAATPSHFQEFYLRGRGFAPSLWLLAWDGEDLAGFVLPSPERIGDPTLGWVYSLGVRPPWRGRGLGGALLQAAFHELHARGLRTVGLGVDAGNETHALRLYERVGMRVMRQQDNWTLDL